MSTHLSANRKLLRIIRLPPSNVKCRDVRGAEDRDAEGVEGVGERVAGIPLPSRLRGLERVVSFPAGSGAEPRPKAIVVLS